MLVNSYSLPTCLSRWCGVSEEMDLEENSLSKRNVVVKKIFMYRLTKKTPNLKTVLKKEERRL